MTQKSLEPDIQRLMLLYASSTLQAFHFSCHPFSSFLDYHQFPWSVSWLQVVCELLELQSLRVFSILPTYSDQVLPLTLY